MKSKIAIRAMLCMLLAILVLSVISGPARADSTVTFTSTADFDAGTKSESNALRNWFATNGVSQPGNWVNSPSAVYYSGRTYIVWQGPDANGSAHHPSPYITYYDHASTTWGPQVRIADAYWITDDDHGAPAMLIDGSGYIHVFFGSHGVQIRYSRSTNPANILTWTQMPLPTLGGSRDTYPRPFLYGTTMYLLLREVNFDGTLAWLTYIKSTDGGSTWTPKTTIVGDTTTVIYSGPAYLWVDQIHVAWTLSTDPGQNEYEAYFNITSGKMFCKGNPNDTDLGTIVDTTEQDASCRIENTGVGSGDLGAVRVSNTGKPYVIYRAKSFGTWVHRFSRWTGTAWSAPENITASKGDRNFADFYVNSDTSIEAYMVASGFALSGPPPQGATRGGNIEKWTWNGATWTKVATVLSEATTKLTLNDPMTVYGYPGSGPKVIFFETYVDEYTFDVSSTLKLWAYDGTDFVKKPEALGTYSTETVTDDGQIASGGFELASGKGDTFSHADADAITSRWHIGRNLGATDGNGGYPRFDISTAAAGKLYLRVQTGSTANAVYSGAISETTISGDFDMQLLPDHVGTDAGTLNVQVLNEDIITPSASATVDGVQYSIFWQSGSGGDRRFTANTVTNGVVTAVGSMTQFTDVNSFARNVRITRVGNTLTWYYNATGSSSWTQDEQTTFTFSGNSRIAIALTTAPDRFVVWTVDDYKLNAVLDVGGYQTSGSWTSATQMYTAIQGVPLSANVTYSGASGNGYIDYIAIVDQTGNVLARDDTNRVAGTSFVWNVPQGANLRKNWAVQIGLAGSGGVTPTIESIVLTTGQDPTCFSASNGGSLVLSMLPILIGVGLVLAIVAAMKLRQEHHESGIDLTGIIVVGVSTVVIFVVLSVVYPLVTTLGNGAGC